jgi:hypothetical protein
MMCLYVQCLLSLSGCGPAGGSGTVSSSEPLGTPGSSANNPPSTAMAGHTGGTLSAADGGTGTSPGAPPTGHGVVGAVDSVDVYGKVSGWAREAHNATGVVSVYIFADGNAATGVALGSVIAHQPGPGGAHGGHYFVYQLPDTWRDGKLHTLYAYASSAIEANLLTGSAQAFVAYMPGAEGERYYNQTLLPLLHARCMPCHAPSYVDHYKFLVTPTPLDGGSALNNTLINKPSGAVAHFRGNLCGDKNSTPCLQEATTVVQRGFVGCRLGWQAVDLQENVKRRTAGTATIILL